ncbi:MAG: V4R domain-containing protein [Myxococcota bacterium]
MSVVIGPQPIKHNYFNSEDYFRYDNENGTVLCSNDQRAFYASEDFILGLVAGLEDEVGDAAAVVLYKCGFEWGLGDVKRFESSMYREFGRDVQGMNLQFVMEQWWWPLQTMGWGSWQIDFESKQEQGLILIDLYDSAVAKSLGEVGKPVCFVYAGLFAGVLTHLARRSLSGIEIQCYAMGATYCRFIVGSQKRIDAVEFWLDEGATAGDVLKKV